MGIAAKLVAAMKDIDAVEKEGTNQAQGYKYVKASDVANEVRKAFVKHGIAFGFDVISEERWQTDRFTKDGTMIGHMNYVSLKINCEFEDAETGEVRKRGAVGWGSDVGDKAVYKALTGALKYSMRCSFLIPDELDPENEKAEVEKEVERQKASGKKHEPAFASQEPGMYDDAKRPAKAIPQAINSVEAAKARTAILQQQLSDSQGPFGYAASSLTGVADQKASEGVLHCFVRGVQKKTMGPNTKTPNKEYRSVTFNGRLPNGSNSASCFDTALWEALDNCLDKECKLQVVLKGQYANIEDVVWIQGLGPVEAA